MSASIFYSYSHEDEEYRKTLETHLTILKRKDYISDWHDRRIAPGNNWEDEIDTNLDSADLILLLISSNFLASDYCYDTETIRALERSQNKEAIVIPIILKPCLWKESNFSHLQVLPTDGKPITTWPNEDEAWLNVSEGILNIVKPIREKDSRIHRINVLKETIKSYDEPEKLSKLIKQFLSNYKQWYFSPLRIQKWGSRQSGFEDLSNFSVKEIREAIFRLDHNDEINTILSQKGNPIYKIKS